MTDAATDATGPKSTRRRPDWAALAIAAALLAVAAIIALDSTRLGGAASYARIGPQTVPYVIALCLAGLGLWTLVEAIRRDFPEREPQELLPAMPPMVARLAVDGSMGKNRPWGRR